MNDDNKNRQKWKMEVRDFSFAYPEGMPVLTNVNFQMEEGEFLVMCGPSGSGKTTLLRCMKKQIAPEGRKSGFITPLKAGEAGFVFQDPEHQIVTDTVRHELAFGLENLGLPPETIRRRVAETALFFGIDEWLDASVHEISGGQKQLLNLAAVIAMRPKVLLLDEPASQLDAVARKNFLDLLARVNQELGITVLLSEHQMGEILPLADRVLFLEEGRLVFDGGVREYTARLLEEQHVFARALPAAARIAGELKKAGVWNGTEYPLTVREGRRFLLEILENSTGETIKQIRQQAGQRKVSALRCLYADHLWFRYHKNSPFVLKGLSLEISKGTLHAVLGGNGSGKTTLLYVLGKRLYPDRGKIRLGEDRHLPSIALLPQNPKAMFSYDTVEEELKAGGCSTALARRLGIWEKRSQHPYDLSGGEQQRLGLCLALAGEPELLLLDEPTKGLDVFRKEELAELLQEYIKQGNTVLMVTHDVEFASEYADVCSMLSEGEVLSTEPTEVFFADNAFYTTDMQRILRGIVEVEG